jgi:tRNA (guanine37-N1)-methyltransferase
MLMKAQPIIDSVESIISKIKWTYKILFLSPSKIEFYHNIALNYSKLENIILISGRYEWIDYRFEQYFSTKYWNNFEKISIWKYILLWWEVASMVVIESVWRLVPWVIKEDESWKNESYVQDKLNDDLFLEYPQYTRPQKVFDYEVPKVLLSWNHAEINKWRENNKTMI